MAKLPMEKVKIELRNKGFTYVEGEYANLKSPLKAKCAEGHEFFISVYETRRGKGCPICIAGADTGFVEFVEKDSPPKKGRRILALDNATYTTGYAIFEGEDFLNGGIFEAHKNKPLVERILQLQEWLVEMLKEWEIDILGLEDVQYQRNPQTLITLAKLLGVLELTGYKELKKAPQLVLAATWKSHCGVKGRNRYQQKESAQTIVKQEYNISVSQDLSDAILLGRYLVFSNRFEGKGGWVSNERER